MIREIQRFVTSMHFGVLVTGTNMFHMRLRTSLASINYPSTVSDPYTKSERILSSSLAFYVMQSQIEI